MLFDASSINTGYVRSRSGRLDSFESRLLGDLCFDLGIVCSFSSSLSCLSITIRLYKLKNSTVVGRTDPNRIEKLDHTPLS